MTFEEGKNRDGEIIKQVIKIFSDNNLSIVDADEILKSIKYTYYNNTKITELEFPVFD